MNHPYGVAADSQCVYVADTFNHRVLVYSLHDGHLLFQLGHGRGTGDTQFNYPMGLSLDPHSQLLYVADSENNRVCVWRTSDCSFLRHWKVSPPDNPKAKPIGVTWHNAANVLYVNLDNSTMLCIY
eukprot:TRINITY_DN17807_c0_g1_i2.p1 TRINITY_DN17807_c0_g1~~TRINITY_DN17807_c0_g1_i2.p1  ORF type:complete len:143 (-),score=19.73 TRINITY_DN17807_c0_g1_i2:50-427(-)